jgi:putative PEP-CTERM system response regulator
MMPGMSGEALLRAARTVSPDTEVVLVTAYGTVEGAVAAMKEGAYDFLPKPFDPQHLDIVVCKALERRRLVEANRLLQDTLDSHTSDILGDSQAIREAIAVARKAAAASSTVLLLGESGTGKEVVAGALHVNSTRREGPFVSLNCAAITESLMESELFGHEKGAFTGAHIQRKGRVELAGGGTLFLDEIGDLSGPLQVKLLRFLQEHRIERIGGREQIDVDVRVIAATNRDLKTAMREGRFREDLYYRLGVVVIPLPPLREREGDIPLLATTLLQRFGAEAKRKISAFTPQALRAMERYQWPGNVRELENRVKRAVIMAEGTKITPADLDLDTGSGRYEGTTLREVRDAVEKELVQQALRRHNGNVTRAATELDISRPTMYELMEKLGIPRNE